MVPFKINLKGKTVVVTGGGGVLCRAFARSLSECGANIAVLDLNETAAIEVANEIIKDFNVKAIGLKANVLEKESLEKSREIIVKEIGNCDILINGAGGNNPKGTTTKEYFEKDDLENDSITTFFDLDPKSVEFVFNLNFIGTLLPTQVFAKRMLEKEGSTIINISSMNAFTPLTKIPAYSGAKAAVSNFTQWLAVHFSKSNIRVNAIAPGFFETNQNKALLRNPDGTYSDRANKIISQTPLRRFGKEEELIGTLLWLVDYKSSSFVNGTVIPVDGGFSAYSGV